MLVDMVCVHAHCAPQFVDCVTCQLTTTQSGANGEGCPSEDFKKEMAMQPPLRLPAGPSGLCFNRNHFIGDNFSVDVFLHNHRNAASLETIRDDLGIYLKVLRSAMIELINKDYADFVNLSANLIGLDKEINNIQSPLGQLREEVLHVNECLTEAMKELSGRLEQRRILRERKKSLQYLSQTQSSLQKLSKILNIDNVSKEDITQELIERASSEYNQLQFTITKCESFITSEQKELVQKIGNVIKTTLGEMLFNSLQTKKVDRIQRCLQIFSMLDQVAEVETLLQKKIIAPAMHDIISESALQKNPTGLKGIYSSILTFIDNKLKDLIFITKPNKSTSVKGYNIILNSFWPEIEYRLEVHMSSIFAPGNPELFYTRYNDSLEFLKKLEQYFDDSKTIEQFHNHSQYKNFQQKWNLPIYFQIRFQEIAGSFENVLSETINNQSFSSGDSEEYRLNATKICFTSLTSCWAQGIFILTLTHRFFKLTLQIISRYCTWIDVAIKQPWSNQPQSSQNPASPDNISKDKINWDKLKFLVSLYSDIRKLVDNLPSLLEIIKMRLQPMPKPEILDKCLLDSKICLETRLPQIQKIVVVQLSAESIVHLKQLNDIPRLFRKTNRDIPTKPCTYVNALMKCPIDFYNLYLNAIGKDQVILWLEDIFSIITTQYYIAVDDVLTSVQKTEDSLRRLKQIRDRPSQQNFEKAGVSDDDKIRIQLKVDVEAYRSLLIEVRVDPEKVERLSDLLTLTDKATSAKSNTTQ
ncbi:conserved oligomeric Golgi complex subunit 2 [Arctopsyche grandis]|uniref:conserved oligomeric Golgi complex subunit 2 n=1 Tax=Arctopsyche grandis TaxID=121162 RepID=UPI00406D8326